jgi:hypothetical protein
MILLCGYASRERALAMAGLLKEKADIFAVGVTNLTDDTFLSNISSGGVMGVNWFSSPTFEGLNDIRDQVVQQTCITAATVPSTTSKSTTFAAEE